MGAFLFRCPNTGLHVQAWSEEVAPSDNLYVPLSCVPVSEDTTSSILIMGACSEAMMESKQPLSALDFNKQR